MARGDDAQKMRSEAATYRWISWRTAVVLQLCRTVMISSKQLTGTLQVGGVWKSWQWSILHTVKCGRLRRGSGRLKARREVSLWTTGQCYRATTRPRRRQWTVLADELCSHRRRALICATDCHCGIATHCTVCPTWCAVTRWLLAWYMWQTIARLAFHFCNIQKIQQFC